MKTFTHKDRSELDIRVAQEIKNHKDWMYDTCQSINSFNEKILDLSKKQQLAESKNASDIKSILIAFENLKENSDKLFKDLVDRIGSAESQLYKVLKKFKALEEEITDHRIKKEECEKDLSDLENLVISNNLKHTLKNDNFNHYLEQLKVKIQEDLKSVRQEATQNVPDVSPIKGEINEMVKVWKIDFAGLVREIDLLKKAVSYDQKKFENIYTLIERLKARTP